MRLLEIPKVKLGKHAVTIRRVALAGFAAGMFAGVTHAQLATGSSVPVPVSTQVGNHDSEAGVTAESDDIESRTSVSVASNETSKDRGPETGAVPDAELPDAPEAKVVDAYTRTVYVKPTEKTRLKNYLFSAWGPLPLVSSAMVAGINQAEGNPHEWGGGFSGFGRRWGSNYGIGAVTTTARYGLARLTGEDTLYYRCECSGFFPRFKHAMFSTVTGRRGDDGHRIFSVPSVVAPYVGSMTAVYGWYPGRYSYKDALRIGNYNLLIYAGNNVVLEFFPSSAHSLMAKFHMQNRHAAPEDAR